MIRKHFRLKRIALGLAFAAIAVPVAQAKPVSEIQGHGGTTPTMSQLEAQANAYQTRVQATPTPEIQAGLSAVSAQQSQAVLDTEVSSYEVVSGRTILPSGMTLVPSAIRSDYSSGAPGPSGTGAAGHVEKTVVSTSNRFDWSDAGIGASVAFGVALMLLMAVALGRRYRGRLDRTLASA